MIASFISKIKSANSKKEVIDISNEMLLAIEKIDFPNVEVKIHSIDLAKNTLEEYADKYDDGRYRGSGSIFLDSLFFLDHL